MKKIIYISLFISIVSVFMISCSNDKNENGKNFIKIIETTENGVAENSVFTYNKNQIISVENSKELIEYTYEDELITKISGYNKLNGQSELVEYSYFKGKLIKVTSSDGEVIYYTHTSDEVILYEKYKINSQNQEKKVYHGTLSFKNENLIKDERVFDDVNIYMISNSTTTFEYDTYKNPYSSIVGYDKLLDQGIIVSKNNAVLIVAETTIINEGQTISSANLYRTSFKYDADDYPTEQVSESGITNPNYLKIEYLY